MALRIEKVEVYCLQDPQANYVRFEGSYKNVLVVVYGDNGMYGIGETDSPPEVIRALIEAPAYNHLSCGLAAVLEGEVLDDPHRLWKKMYDSTNWHGRYGVAIHAISALDIAIWDLFARYEGQPLSYYFGGSQHYQLPAYATIYPMSAEPGDFVEQISECLSQGFKRIKVCVEPWWSDYDKTAANLRQLREFIGDDVHLMLDVAMEFTRLEELQAFLPLLKELDFRWIEAPFELDNLQDHRALKELTDIPVGVGDLGFTTCKEFQPYIQADAFDIAQPDITLFGGVSEVINLQQQLVSTDKRIIPHAYNTDLTISVNAAFLSAQSVIEPLEYSTSPSRLRREMIKNPLTVDENGMITIPQDIIGLGIELNWDLIHDAKRFTGKKD